MTTNPLSATKKIQESYVNFYKYNFALHNDKLSEELENLAQNNRLWKSPYISITQSYEPGPDKLKLIAETGVNEDVIESIGINKFHKHQGESIKNIVKNERHTVISSGTGSGKTESFLIPILNECTKSDVSGIKAIIIYPMNALTGDQVTRIRKYLYKLNKKREGKQRAITFGVYNGATPEYAKKDGKNDQRLERLKLICPKCGKDELGFKISEQTSKAVLSCKREADVEIDFELLTRNDLRENPPDILITNYVMLERILVKKKDQILFKNNKVKFLVLDEIHTYGGARGVDVSLLLRRFKRRLNADTQENLKMICIGTSATMSKSDDVSERKLAVANFASTLLGEKLTNSDVFEGKRIEWELPPVITLDQFENLDPPDTFDENYSEEDFRKLCERILGESVPTLPKSEWEKYLGKILLSNPIFQFLVKNLAEPRSIDDLQSLIIKNESIYSKINLPTQEYALNDFIWSYLKAGSLAINPNNNLQESLLRVSVHNFFRMLPQIFKCTNPKCGKIFFVNRDDCDECKKKVEELGVCRNCSQEFFITIVDIEDLKHETRSPEMNRILEEHGDASSQFEEPIMIKRNNPNNSEENFIPSDLWYTVVDGVADEDEDEDEDDTSKIRKLKKCLDCGTISPLSSKECNFKVNDIVCGCEELIIIETYPPKSDTHENWRPRDCPFCHYNYGSGWAVTQIQMAEKQVAVNLFNMIYDYIENKKLLIFTDTRQDAAELALWLDFAHDDTALKQLITQKLGQLDNPENEPIDFDRFSSKLIQFIEDDWYGFNFEAYDRKREDFERELLLEMSNGKRLSLERLGLIQYDYRGLNSWDDFKTLWKSLLSRLLPSRKISDKLSNILELTSPLSLHLIPFIITILNMIRREEALEGLENKKGQTRTNAHGFEFDRNGKSKQPDWGVKIHNLVRKNNKFVKYTKKIFQLEENEDAIDLLETVWNFLIKRGYVIQRPLIMYSYEPTMGYVVSTGKLLLSVPKIIQQCSECKNIYANLPNNECLTYTRQKFCEGKAEEYNYNDFAGRNQNSYFFDLFKNKPPSRMITQEHTGALTDIERNNIQTGFLGFEQNDRRVDVVVATPTLELGVDIGDLSSIGLYKSPPSPVNYLQRVGRAGRRNGIAFINTFFFNSPIDEFYYRNPQDLIKGNFSPPPINLDNEELIDRHLNSVILEHVALSQEANPFDMNVKVFLERREENTKNLFALIEKKHDKISSSIRKILDDFKDIERFNLNEKLLKYKSNFEKGFNKALDYFIEEYQACLNGLNEYEQKGSPSDYGHSWSRVLLRVTKEKLETRKIENHLFEVNFLPRYAFPGTAVSIEDIKGGQGQGGRARQIAITEFAPSCEVTYRKKKWKSIGIDRSNVYQKIFYVCDNCQKFYDTSNWEGEICPFCNRKSYSPIRIDSIAPTKIYIEKSKKSITESNYRQANLDIFLSKPQSDRVTRSLETNSYDISLENYGNTRLLLSVNGVFSDYVSPEEEGDVEAKIFEICDECGKVKEKGSKRHKPINQKFSRRREFCHGEYQKLSLHHEMPTNIISITISDKKNPVKTRIENKRFMTTLKNAIIFAGQSITESLEGEIGGVIKDDELFLYDNVEGGANYVNTIFEKFEQVIQKAHEIITGERETYGEECEHGCLRCLWSYRNKRDIGLIDKKLILPFLQECTHLNIIDIEQGKKKLKIDVEKNFEQITSIQNNLDNAKVLKNYLRSAKKEIIIYSPTISDKKIDWDDEGSKNWIDILTHVRKSEKNPSVSVFLKKSDSIDEKIIKKMLDNDIDVYYVHDYSLEHMLVVTDPFEESNRKSLEFSCGLTVQIWKDISTLFLGKDDDAITLIQSQLQKIREYSRKVHEIDLLKLEKSESYPIYPFDKISIEKAVIAFEKLLSSVKYEIEILDPYMKSNDPRETLHYYMSHFCKFLPKNVKIKIITAGHTQQEIQSIKSSFSSYGYKIDIISYDVIPPNRRISHRRFMLIDDQKSVWIDKGLRFLYEKDAYGTMRELSGFGVFTGTSIVKKDCSVFDKFWNYKNSEQEKKWPKNDTRNENES